MFRLLIFLTLLGFAISQAVNPFLVIPGYFCAEKKQCFVDDSHCNPLNQCQCNFGYYPTGGKEYKDCYPRTCYADDSCVYYYGPNTRCDSVTKNCVCKDGWTLDSVKQQCIVKA